MKLTLSNKRMKIDRANAIMVAVIAGSSFVIIFSLVASNQLLSLRGYQSRVIDAKSKAKKQLDDNVKAANNLSTSYQAFVGTPENILGGSKDGKGDKDGDNARIILDALPSKYDYPALTTSLEKMITSRNGKIAEISGEDDEINQQKQTGSNQPKPIDMPFKVTVKGNYDATKDLVSYFEHSIRPFPLQQLILTATENGIKMEMTGKSFYLPEKTLDIKSKVVK